MSVDIAVVMPVYNEVECIEGVLRSWADLLQSLSLDFRMVVLNDGSSDGTDEVLARFSEDSHFLIVDKGNSGHGPTILQGYRQAVEIAEWVFQCDSDGEMSAGDFAGLWAARDGYDACLATREGREQAIARRITTAGSRLAVRALFGNAVRDVNVPYRLIRASVLKTIISGIPCDTLAPNILISGALSMGGYRVMNHPVPCKLRCTGTVSIVKWGLWKFALRSLFQTLAYRVHRS